MFILAITANGNFQAQLGRMKRFKCGSEIGLPAGISEWYLRRSDEILQPGRTSDPISEPVLDLPRSCGRAEFIYTSTRLLE